VIGNDIVDLKEASLTSNWKRPGFLNKVFSPEEQRLLHTSSNPFQTVWRMWSMKESAYKFYLQKTATPIKGFYPAKVICERYSPTHGQVTIQGLVVETTSIIHPEYIFSTAFSNVNIPTETAIFFLSEKNYQFQTTFIRDKLLDFLAQKKQLNKIDLTIEKNQHNIPEIFYKKKPLPIACSLTHHGNYGGFSLSSI